MPMRLIKKQILALLQKNPLQAALSSLSAWPPRQVVNPLIGLLYHDDPQVRWHAIAALGQVVARLADAEMESARVIMRRLMWSLNDESGGIGWGAPEAMAEIMANHEGLAREYASILISYLDPDGNFLEHPGLQQGTIWGVGRLAQARPELAADAAPFILPFLSSSDDTLRGLAARAARALRSPALKASLRALLSDQTPLFYFDQGRFVSRTIGRMAREALE